MYSCSLPRWRDISSSIRVGESKRQHERLFRANRTVFSHVSKPESAIRNATPTKCEQRETVAADPAALGIINQSWKCFGYRDSTYYVIRFMSAPTFSSTCGRTHVKSRTAQIRSTEKYEILLKYNNEYIQDRHSRA